MAVLLCRPRAMAASRRRVSALALLLVVALAVAVEKARAVRLHAVDSAAPWGAEGRGEDIDLREAKHEDRGWSWKLPQAAMTVVKECLSSSSAPDTTSCIRTMAARALDRVEKTQREINLGAGLVLVPDAKETTRSLDAAGGGGGGSNSSSASANGDEALGPRLLSLLKGYSLRLQLPSSRTIREAIDAPVNASSFTGRRRNGGIAPLLVFGSSLLPVKMSLLALLVGKALMLSTLAFAIPALRLLQGGGMGGGGGGGGGHHCH
ncbi:D-amino acid dehydrogenase [Frankliniella fusca]|uniref:D-amino acid dehydrogenase n=1 Tax=Frankliniella fusca TaxID=407009 RepID=A0AAE1GV41_9NEOP|nr:D-amino acid dehydrogenase [Frankliniella fusca]